MHETLSTALESSNYKLIDPRQTSRKLNFLVLRIGTKIMKLTEQHQFLSLDQRELTLSKMLIASKPNELVSMDSIPENKELRLELQEDLTSSQNFQLFPISINHKSNIRPSMPHKESLILGSSKQSDLLRKNMQCILASTAPKGKIQDLVGLKLEDKQGKLRVTQIMDLRKNKVKYCIKKHQSCVPQKLLLKLKEREWSCVVGPAKSKCTPLF